MIEKKGLSQGKGSPGLPTEAFWKMTWSREEVLQVCLCTTWPQTRWRMPVRQGLREKFLGALIIEGSDDSVRSHGNDLRSRAVERILRSGVFG